MRVLIVIAIAIAKQIEGDDRLFFANGDPDAFSKLKLCDHSVSMVFAKVQAHRPVLFAQYYAYAYDVNNSFLIKNGTKMVNSINETRNKITVVVFAASDKRCRDQIKLKHYYLFGGKLGSTPIFQGRCPLHFNKTVAQRILKSWRCGENSTNVWKTLSALLPRRKRQNGSESP